MPFKNENLHISLCKRFLNKCLDNCNFTIYDRNNKLTFNQLIMILNPLQTALNQTRRRVTLVWFQAVCHSAKMSSKF